MFCDGNPINKIDPDGRAAEWVPVIQGDRLLLKKEEGDNAASLAKFLDVSQKTADKLYSNMGSGNTVDPGKYHSVWVINKAIKDYKKNPDDYKSSIFNGSNYDCHESSLACLNQRSIDYENIINGSKLSSKLNNPVNGYEEVTNQKDEYIFSRTLIKFSDKNGNTTHSSTYLGTSNDGTIYTWSKNGNMAIPTISTLPKDQINWLSKAVKFYNR